MKERETKVECVLRKIFVKDFKRISLEKVSLCVWVVLSGNKVDCKSFIFYVHGPCPRTLIPSTPSV